MPFKKPSWQPGGQVTTRTSGGRSTGGTIKTFPQVNTSAGQGTSGPGGAAPASSEFLSLASGILPLQWGYSNVAASLTAAGMYRIIPGATVVAVQRAVSLPSRGFVHFITWQSSEAITASGITILTTISGNIVHSMTAGVGSSSGYETLDTTEIELASFEAGDYTEQKITTDSAFTPTTLDLEVIVGFALNPEVLG
jgi:hypothetical protein